MLFSSQCDRRFLCGFTSITFGLSFFDDLYKSWVHKVWLKPCTHTYFVKLTSLKIKALLLNNIKANTVFGNAVFAIFAKHCVLKCSVNTVSANTVFECRLNVLLVKRRSLFECNTNVKSLFSKVQPLILLDKKPNTLFGNAMFAIFVKHAVCNRSVWVITNKRRVNTAC